MLTLVPIGTFEERARKLLGNAGFDDLLTFLSQRPNSGKLIQGTGGLRKLRFGQSGRGKRGGVRVIYYYYNDTKPILLLLVYAKANQESLTDKQKEQLKKLVDAIITGFS